jgi:beta-glucanase (GH16 family)
MKRSGAILVFLFLSSGLSSQLLLQINKDSTHTWYYNQGDEFNAEQINTAYWSYHFGWGRSIYPNKEQQYYTDGENHRLQNGKLSLYAEKRTVNKKIVDWRPEQDSIIEKGINYGANKRDFTYTAGMLQSNKAFKYGYFEIKFRMPSQAGFWPAFWLYGCSPNEEIDMMELKTEASNKIHIGRYSQNPKENFTRQGLFKRAWGEWVKVDGDLGEGYHIVSGEWTKTHLKYYLNGELIAYSPISMNCPKYLVANIAVPSNDGPFKPGPADSTKHSGNFEIDYIRVWSQQDSLLELPSFITADTSITMARTRMRNTGRATYGSKKLHKNEGFSFSVFPKNSGYELCVLGKEIPTTLMEVFDVLGNKVSSQNLRYGITYLNLAHDQKLFLKFTAYNRQHILLLFEGRITKEKI